MRLLHYRPLALLLDLLRPRHQYPHRARLLLALGHNHHRLPLLQLAAPVPVLIHPLIRHALSHRLPGALRRQRQAAALARQPRRHKRRAAKHEADGAAVDADGGEGLGEAVHEAQVREQRRLNVELEEERLAVDDVEADAVGELDLLERRLLGEELVDVRGEEGVGGEERGAEGALD